MSNYFGQNALREINFVKGNLLSHINLSGMLGIDKLYGRFKYLIYYTYYLFETTGYEMNRSEYIEYFFNTLIKVAPNSIPEGLKYKASLLKLGRQKYDITVVHELSIVKNFSFSFSNLFTKNFTIKWIKGGRVLPVGDVNMIMMMMSQNTADKKVNLEAALAMIMHNIYFPNGYVINKDLISDSSVSGVGLRKQIPDSVLDEVEKIYSRGER